MKSFTLAISVAALAAAGVALAATDAPTAQPMKHRAMGGMTITRADAEAKAREVFDRLDLNHDGKLDKADRELKEIEHFKQIDTDGNDSISQAEFLAAHDRKPGGHKMGMGMDHGMAPPSGAGPEDAGPSGHSGSVHMMGFVMLRMADANHDGVVSRDEFVAAALAHFDQTDTNHDGKVTPEERRAAMKAMHDHMGGGMRGMGGKMGHPMGDGPPPPPPGN